MKAIDFFCGAGGLTRGLVQSGIDVVAGLDIDSSCQATYEYNNKGIEFIRKDIKNVNSELLKKLYSENDALLFAGCAPCQPFSHHRKSSPKSDSARLLKEFGRLIVSVLPDYVLMENVPGMAKVLGYSTYRRFLNSLGKYNYNCNHEVLNAKHFGVPQNRKRLVLIAAKNKVPTLPEPEYGEENQPFRTVRDAISHLPKITAGENHGSVNNHVAARLSELNLERLRFTPSDGGDRRSWPDHLKLHCHSREHTGYTDVYGRLRWDDVAPTLTSRCNSLSNGRFGHPQQNRAISLREAAALQSFPDDYVFFGTNNEIARQIGNAVPIELAKRLGRHLLMIESG